MVSSYTRHVWDKTNPNVTLAKHLRYPNGKVNIKAEHSFTGGVYVCFDEAFRLDSHAALLSTSWGKFQIMGFNYKKAGYDSPEAMVAAMRRSVDDQLQAFTGFVLSDHVLTSAFQNKNWAALASHYNGGSYQSNDYDNSLRSRYEALTGKVEIVKSILCVLAILIAFRVPVVGQVVSRPLTLQELVLARSKLSTQMIPAYSDFFNVQNKQAFAVPGPGNESTWLVPVFYNAKAEQGGGEQCGIFAIRSSGAVNFTETFGPEIYKGKFGPDTNINVNCDHL